MALGCTPVLHLREPFKKSKEPGSKSSLLAPEQEVKPANPLCCSLVLLSKQRCAPLLAKESVRAFSLHNHCEPP